MLGSFGEFQGVEVGEGDAEVLRLAALIRAHGYVAVSAAGEAWVYSVLLSGQVQDSLREFDLPSTKRRFALLAIATPAIRDILRSIALALRHPHYIST